MITERTLLAWAHLVTALKKAEIRRAAGADDDEENAWTEGSLADLGWDEPAGALSIPAPLFAAWDYAVKECNPGLFGYVPAPEGKATGLISVE